MPLSGDLVATGLNPPGIQRVHHVVSGLHGRLGIREVELGLPVRSFGGGKRLLRQPQLMTFLPFTFGRSALGPSSLRRFTGIVVLRQPIVSNLDELDGPALA